MQNKSVNPITILGLSLMLIVLLLLCGFLAMSDDPFVVLFAVFGGTAVGLCVLARMFRRP